MGRQLGVKPTLSRYRCREFFHCARVSAYLLSAAGALGSFLPTTINNGVKNAAGMIWRATSSAVGDDRGRRARRRRGAARRTGGSAPGPAARPLRACGHGTARRRSKASPSTRLPRAGAEPPQPRQRVAFIVGIRREADYRSGSPDLLRQRPLAQPSPRAEVVDYGRNLRVEKPAVAIRVS